MWIQDEVSISSKRGSALAALMLQLFDGNQVSACASVLDQFGLRPATIKFLDGRHNGLTLGLGLREATLAAPETLRTVGFPRDGMRRTPLIDDSMFTLSGHKLDVRPLRPYTVSLSECASGMMVDTSVMAPGSSSITMTLIAVAMQHIAG